MPIWIIAVIVIVALVAFLKSDLFGDLASLFAWVMRNLVKILIVVGSAAIILSMF